MPARRVLLGVIGAVMSLSGCGPENSEDTATTAGGGSAGLGGTMVGGAGATDPQPGLAGSSTVAQSCGNGTVEAGETCDPPATCATACNDGNDCTLDELSGSADSCNAACTNRPVFDCASGDGCCPSGCSAASDSDCSTTCDNGVLDAGETCDPPSSCPTSCDDGNACTLDQLTGSAQNCNVACSHGSISTCASGDGCCPSGCGAASDSDCSTTCDNGVLDAGETCDPPSSCPTSCDDGDACTLDQLTGSAQSCNVACTHNTISTCSSGDDCCPSGCSATDDSDCGSPTGYRWRSVRIGGGGFVSAVIASPAQQNLIFARTDVGGAYRWDNGTESWTPITDWVSDQETGFLGVESIAVDPQEPNRVYLLAGISYFNGGKTAILRSDDHGDTFTVTEVTSQFTAHGNGMGRQSGERLAVDPNNGSVLYCGTRENGLFRSTDRGANWSRVASLNVTTTSNGNGIPFVVFNPSSGTSGGATRDIYVGVSRSGQTNLYVSRDAGSSWNAVADQPATYVPGRAALASDGTLYLTYGNGAGPHGTTTDAMDQGAVWKLDTASGTFTNISPLTGSQNRAMSGISVDATNPNRIVATTINTYWSQPWGWGDRVFISTNGGSSWTDLIGADRVVMDTDGHPWIEDHALHWAGSIAIDPFNPARVFVTSGNGIFMTDDINAATSTWKFASAGLEETVPLDAVSLPSGPLVTVIGDYDGFVHPSLVDSPPTGSHNPGMGTTEGLTTAAQNPSLLARVGSTLYVSSNAGGSWTAWSRPSSATNGRLAFSANGSVLLWSVGNTTYRTANQASSWSTVSSLSFETHPTADTINSDKFYAYDAGGGEFYVSTDGGQSFSGTATLPRRGSRRIRAAPGVEGDVWVAVYGSGLRRSTDSGTSFQTVPGVTSCGAVGFGAAPPGHAYPAVYIWGAADGPTGLYRSDDAGATWTRINDDAHEFGGPGNGQFVLGDANVYGRVYMSTAGRGVIYGELVP